MLTTVDIEAFLKERIDQEAIREGGEHVKLEKVDISKLTSHLVGGIVEGTKVQIHFAPEQVLITKACSCLTRKCGHIAGLLLKLTERKKNTFANKAGYWRKVIDEMPEEDKAAFILEQVRRNKSIAYDLRAMLLRQEGLYSVERAKEMVEELKSPIVRSTKSPTAPQVRLFGQVTKTTLKSVSDLLDQGYNYQALAILLELMESLHYVYYRLKRTSGAILNHIQSVEEKFVTHFSLIRAPEAQYEILERWQSLTSKSYYIPTSEENIIVFFRALPSTDVRQSMMRHVEKQTRNKTGFVHGIWSQIWIELAINQPDISTELTLEDISEYKRDALWAQLTQQDVPETLRSFFREMLEWLPEKHLKNVMSYLSKYNMVQEALMIMSSHEHIIYMETNSEMATQLFKAMKKSPNYTLAQVSSVLAKTGNVAWVKAFIHKKNDLLASLPLLPALQSSDIDELEEVLLDQVKTYLNTHIGLPSERTMQNLLSTLELSGNTKLKKSVKQVLKKSFGYRNDMHNVLST